MARWQPGDEHLAGILLRLIRGRTISEGSQGVRGPMSEAVPIIESNHHVCDVSAELSLKALNLHSRVSIKYVQEYGSIN